MAMIAARRQQWDHSAVHAHARWGGGGGEEKAQRTSLALTKAM